MKVLIFAPYANSSGHHEVDLEMALKHKKEGDEVHIIHCMGELTTCDPNPFHKKLACMLCENQSMRSFDIAGIPRERRYPLGLTNVLPVEEVPKFQNFEEMKKYTWNGKPAGMAAVSAVVSGWRDTEPDFEPRRYVISHMVSMYAAVYTALARHIDRIQPDVMYMFNGRVAILNAAFWAARDRGVKVYVCDRYIFREYLLFENALSTDVEYNKNEITKFAEKMHNDPQGKEIANGWFFTNRQGNQELLCNYLLDQKIGKLPDNFDTSKRNIVMFGSSEDEVFGAPGWAHPYFKNQTEVIKFVYSNITDKNVHFYLRIHPNLKNLDCAQTRQMGDFKAPNITVIPPEDVVDSYALLEAATTVLVFGSTMGLEACYWGRPSILSGRAFYEHMDVSYVAKSSEELLSLLRADLKPKPKNNALPYGYWCRKRGFPMQHVTPHDPTLRNTSQIAGSNLGISRPVYVVLRGTNLVTQTLKKLAA